MLLRVPVPQSISIRINQISLQHITRLQSCISHDMTIPRSTFSRQSGAELLLANAMDSSVRALYKKWLLESNTFQIIHATGITIRCSSQPDSNVYSMPQRVHSTFSRCTSVCCQIFTTSGYHRTLDFLPSNTPCLSNDRQKLRPRLATVHSPFHAAADTFVHCRHRSVSRAADNRPGIQYTSAERTCLGYDNQTPNFPFIRLCQSDSSRITVPRSAYIAQTNEWPVKVTRKRIDGNERARETQRIDKTNA